MDCATNFQFKFVYTEQLELNQMREVLRVRIFEGQFIVTST
jgi:hypothetical protein